MKKKILAILLTIALVIGMTACGASSAPAAEAPAADGAAAAAPAEEKVETRYLTLSAVAASSGLFPYCVSLGECLSNLPELDITVAESGGNVANTRELRIGEVSIANSISNTDYESYTGTGTTFTDDPFTDFRILWYYESTPIQVFVAEDTGISSLEELDGQVFNPGGTGTAAAVVMHAALDALDIHPEYFEAAQADAEESAASAAENATLAGEAKGAAEGARNAAIQARTDAEAARDAAIAAKNAAEASNTSATAIANYWASAIIIYATSITFM